VTTATAPATPTVSNPPFAVADGLPPSAPSPDPIVTAAATAPAVALATTLTPPPVAPAATHTFASFKSAGYFNALDGLRACSILLVLLHHVPDFAPGALRLAQLNGRYGVSFFFAISGFLICTLLLREKERTGRVEWGKFYARRALRLLPLYYVTLLLQCVLVFALHQYSPENQELFRAKLPAYVGYFSNWLASATQGPFFYAWSLAVEEQFYLGFGLLLWLVPRQHLVALLAFALGTKFAVYEVFGSIDANSVVWRILFSYQEAILWGVLLAFALNTRTGFNAAARVFRSGWTVAGLGAATAGVLCFVPIQTQSTWDAELLYILMTLMVAGTVVRQRSPLLGCRPLLHIGKISYGIYLLHTFVIYAVKKLPAFSSPAICFLVSVPLSIMLASLVYRTFEQPIIAYYKRRLSPLEKIAHREVGVAVSTGAPACDPL
jgi:peptidoglycan/LPS O-acetylase OafA/YrhL